MAPPRKRRRLTESLPSPGDMPLFEPIPTFTHSVEDLGYTPRLLQLTKKAAPKRVEEVHLHVQERTVALEGAESLRLERRQITDLVTTVDALGSTIVSVVTAGLDAGAATSVTPTPTPTPATPSTNAAAPTTSSSASHHSHISSGKVSLAAESSNSTSTGKGTGKTTLARTYVATLTNGKVKTITRSSTPYVTTLARSQISTICNQSGQCRLGSKFTKSTKSTKSTRRGRESPIVTTSSAAVFAGGTGVNSLPDTSTATSVAPQQQNSNNNNNPEPALATIAGGVVGGAAGLAVILVGILILLRWYKRRLRLGEHHLAGSESPSLDHAFQPSTNQSGMTERTGLAPFINAMPGFFRHQDKSQEASLSSEQQRGFEKLSGRKLPSAFSEGVDRKDMMARYKNPDKPPIQGSGMEYTTSRNTSFRRDSADFDGSSAPYDPVESPEPPDDPSVEPDAQDSMTLSPGPQRRPTLHEPGPYVVFPRTSSPHTPPRAPVRDMRRPSAPTLSPFEGEGARTPSTFGGRSGTPSTVGDKRSSRFTEDV